MNRESSTGPVSASIISLDKETVKVYSKDNSLNYKETYEGKAMDLAYAIENFYDLHTGLCNAVILLLVFGGLARIAFWREHDGLRVGGPLAVGLAGLLTVALLKWSRAEGRSIVEFGPLAAFVVVEAILIMGWAAFRKSSRS